ncbi:hypothetical protein GJU40_02635 [Bacillus lacus]|uniref:Uncharacterized protein n=1 Tax=Metabacillus lacus TaxID=1983721 RepID=A0A7X2IWQ0_9BACI|nr:hypothetical protein [Metabacillus lacus]MRX71066.1 hypothetical protein [Metabacillus lacus]
MKRRTRNPVMVIVCLVLFGLVAYFSYTILIPNTAKEEQLEGFQKKRLC